MENINLLTLALYGLGAVGIIAVILMLARGLKSPFSYPYKEIYIDVSGERSPKMEDCIDNYLIENDDEYFFDSIDNHCVRVEKWKKKCVDKIARSILKGRRARQFSACLDDKHMIQFIMTDAQGHPLSGKGTRLGVDSEYLAERFNRLVSIGFAGPLSQYEGKNKES